MFKIDLVAPPFAGHLFPLLDLAQFLQQHDFQLRVLSTSKAQEAIRLGKLEHHILLKHHDAAISAIANPPYRVKNNPFYLLKQFEGNLALMKDLRQELMTLWQEDKPNLVLADFTLPLAGTVAQTLGIQWWTSLPTPCALESNTGTPSYLGGWTAANTLLHHWRDKLGRKLIRLFKHFIGWRYKKQLLELGIDTLYRPDGSEVAYSPERILALGIPEFEFERTWPASLRFVGPLTASPPFFHTPPIFTPNEKHILVSLGTHIPWAKEQAATFTYELARLLPDIHFHFSSGKAGQNKVIVQDNLSLYDYIPYDLYLANYTAAIIHGGTGITYSCLKAGIPMLVWPHDYDQFDHAARIIKKGLGLRINTKVEIAAKQLQQLFIDKNVHQNVLRFKQRLESYKSHELILQEILSLSKQ